jgi:hypothetical protein
MDIGAIDPLRDPQHARRSHRRAPRLHGWLALSTTLETILDPGADHEPNSVATTGAMTNPRFEEDHE